MDRNPISTIFRVVTSPVRSYINQHFEALKYEVRSEARERSDEVVVAVGRVDAANAERFAGMSTRVDRLDEQLAGLRAELLDLRDTNDQLLAVVAAMVERPDRPPA